MVKAIKQLNPESHRAIAGRVKSMLKACRRRLGDTRDLGYQLAAAKIIVATLQKQAEESGVPQKVIDLGDEIADDLETTIEALGLAKTLGSKDVH
jgi:hypothetical protein